MPRKEGATPRGFALLPDKQILGFARKTRYVVVDALGGLAISVIVVIPMLTGLETPADPASSFAVLWALSR